VRKALGDSSPEEVAEIDFAGWRAELRGLACATALDAIEGDLRAALVALVCDGGSALPPAGADITALVVDADEARELLRRVVLAWADALEARA
jgi:hypothetical protein